MADPWVEGEELKEHQKAVADSYLSKQARDLRKQEEKLTKDVEKERADQKKEEEEKAAQESLAAEVEQRGNVDDRYRPSETPPPEPAGNVDSKLHTEEELDAAQGEK